MLREKEMTACSRASLVRGKEREPGFRLFCLSLEPCLVSEGFRVERRPAAGHRSELSFCDASCSWVSGQKRSPRRRRLLLDFFFFFSEVQGGVLLAPATPNVGGGTWGGQAE